MKEKIAIISILVNVALSAGKIIVGGVSGSVAIIAEGIHSFIDVFSSLVSYIGIKISLKPEDKKYPYGRYKFEALSGTIITIIIAITGITIMYEAYQGFLNPEKVQIGYLAFGVMLISAIANEVMARLKIYYGKKEDSISLLSDGFHSRIDVYSSLAVLAGLFTTQYWIYADSLLALFIGIYIIKNCFSLGRDSLDSLLDVSAGEEVEKKIKDIANKRKIEIFSLKTQKKGSFVTVNLEIILPSNLELKEATKISDNLRDSLFKEIKNIQYISIQINSHEVESSFYQPSFGRGFGWQKSGKERIGEGPGGYCVCPKCGYKVSHIKGMPCSSIECPKCKINLNRE